MMRARQYRFAGAVLFGLFAPQLVTGQTGRADLRYVAPLPASVVFTSIDSLRNTMTGLGEEIVLTGNIRTTSRIDFPPARRDTIVITLLEVAGQMTTPMGVVPISNVGIAPVEIVLSDQGPPYDRMAGSAAPGGASPGHNMASAQMMAGLLRLPGRILNIGETWDDTVRFAPTVEGMKTDMVVITHGIYAADSVMNGKAINLLQIATEMTMTMKGVMQDTEISSTMTITSKERAGWDSSLHTLVFSNSLAHTNVEMSAPTGGIKTASNATVQHITTMNVTN
jgi:hypothetical protein